MEGEKEDSNNSNNNNSKITYVTGATGFLGNNIVEHLLIQGYTVYALYRSKRKVLELNSIAKKLDKQKELILVKGDITNYKSLIKTIPDKCLYVFHVAAAIEADLSSAVSVEQQEKQQYEINVNGTANVIEACFARGVKRLIHTSTISTYQLRGDKATNEETKKRNFPNLNYPRTKRIAELYVEDAVRRGLDAIIISPGFIIGRYDESSVGSLLLMIAHQSSSVIKCGVGKTNFCSADEVAKAHITAAQTAPAGSEYCLGGNLYSWKSVYEEIFFQLSIEKPVVQVSPLKYVLQGKFNDIMLSCFGIHTSNTSKGVKPISSQANDTNDVDNIDKTTNVSKTTPRSTPYLSFFLAAVQSVNFVIDSTKAHNQLNFKNQTLEYMVNENIKWLKSRNLL